MIPALLTHLWQSTVFAALAGGLALALRKNGAQIRYQLWLVASLKFLVPFSVLVALGNQFPLTTVASVAPFDVPVVLERISASVSPVAALQRPPSPHGFATVLVVVWAMGLMGLSYSWWRRWRILQAVVRRAAPLDLRIGLRAVTSPEFREPGIFGIRRPVLLLPEGIAERLTPAQLEAILTHELCHVRRRDNLAAAMHMVVEAVFWFHPLVWWLGARMMEERERACDEEVLQTGSEPETYAAGILKICEMSLGAPLACVAGVTGGHLKKRIEDIMINRAVPRLSLVRKAALAVAGLTAVAGPIVVGILNAPPISAQTSVPPWQAAAGGKMTFEVGSVRPSGTAPFRSPSFPLDPGESYKATGGRFFADFGVTTYITFAYKLSLTQDQRRAMIAQLPKWVATDRFTIEAKAAVSNPTKDQMRLMMQSLLSDRFGLSIHFESQQAPVYALMLTNPGKTGPKLRPHAEGVSCDSANADAFPAVCEVTEFERRSTGSRAGSRNTTLELIASALPSLGGLNRPVVDQTGLNGKYDFKLEWAPDPDVTSAQSDSERPAFLQAIHEQLGLKLKATTGAVRMPVIERIERPSEN